MAKNKEKVKTELENFRKHAKDYSMHDLKNGNWFAKLLKFSLQKY